MLRRPDDNLRYCREPRGLERLPEKRIHLLTAFGRRKVVRALVELRRDLFQRNERRDIDGLRGLDVGSLEVFVGEHDVFVFLVLISLDDVLPFDVLAGFLAVALVANRREVALVEHGELEFLALLGWIELDG